MKWPAVDSTGLRKSRLQLFSGSTKPQLKGRFERGVPSIQSGRLGEAMERLRVDAVDGGLSERFPAECAPSKPARTQVPRERIALGREVGSVAIRAARNGRLG